MSKGLEADVVIVFGGTHGGSHAAEVRIYHNGYDRQIAIGEQEKDDTVKEIIDRERAEEQQRLLYVAMTRARAKLYLPFYPEESLKLGGPYKHLNQRLKHIVKSNGASKKKAPWSKLIEVVDARELSTALATKRDSIPINQWVPPPELLVEKFDSEILFDRLRDRHAPFEMKSYTSLRNDSARWDITATDFNTDLPPLVESEDLSGGSDVGIFLHEVIERLDFATLTTADTLESWRRIDSVIRLFRTSMERHQVRDPRWFDRGTEIVFRTLTSTIAINRDRTIDSLAQCRNQREMEFLFPLPEAAHPKLGSAIANGWIAERGYLKGFIDFVFEDNGLIYFADWKSDLLSAYDAATISEHVERNYELQALIYSVGVVRLLRIRSEAEYKRRFGGLLYVFLRGVGNGADPSHGIYFQRPDWNEIRRHEETLMKLGVSA